MGKNDTAANPRAIGIICDKSYNEGNRAAAVMISFAGHGFDASFVSRGNVNAPYYMERFMKNPV